MAFSSVRSACGQDTCSAACKHMRSLVRALAWEWMHAWACRLWGREAGRARCRRACLWDGQPFRGAGFFGSCGSSLLLAENYNRITTNNTTEAQSAQRLNGGGRNSLRLDDPCGLWASLARQPIDRGRCPGRCPRLVLLGPPPVGRADRASSQSAGRAFLLCCRQKPLGQCGGNMCGRIGRRKRQEAYRFFFFLSDFINWRYSFVVIPAFTSASTVLGSCSREFRIEGVAS